MASSRVVVLLSGGLDSATTLYKARAEGFDIHTLSFRYGQRHSAELLAAERLGIAAGIPGTQRHVCDLNLSLWGGSALTDSTIPMPRDRDSDAMSEGIPSSYVPGRNTVFIAVALSLAEAVDADTVLVGVNAVDYSGYPDCRPEYIEAWSELTQVANKRGVEGRPITIAAPLIYMSKIEIVREAVDLGVPLEMTHSCYDPQQVRRETPASTPDRPEVGRHWYDYLACGRCDSCRIRAAAFEEALGYDPTRYQEAA